MKYKFLILIEILNLLCCLQIPVYKLTEYQYKGVHYGSLVSSFNLIGIHYKNFDEIARKIVVVHLYDLDLEILQTMLAYKPSGILIILEENDFDKFKDIEIFLGTHKFVMPVYFTFRNPEIMKIYDKLQEDHQPNFKFVVKSKHGNDLIKPILLENFYGFINKYNSSLPIMLVTAHYDSFSIVPELSFGINSNLSGTICILEIIKFLKTYLPIENLNYNVMVLLTSGGSLNFNGLQH